MDIYLSILQNFKFTKLQASVIISTFFSTCYFSAFPHTDTIEKHSINLIKNIVRRVGILKDLPEFVFQYSFFLLLRANITLSTLKNKFPLQKY